MEQKPDLNDLIRKKQQKLAQELKELEQLKLLQQNPILAKLLVQKDSQISHLRKMLQWQQVDLTSNQLFDQSSDYRVHLRIKQQKQTMWWTSIIYRTNLQLVFHSNIPGRHVLIRYNSKKKWAWRTEGTYDSQGEGIVISLQKRF